MKNSYQTRRLLALRDMRHDGQNVNLGGEVFATEIDARYLIRAGAARDPDEAAKDSTKVIASPQPARRGPGRPPRAEVAARAPAPAPVTMPPAGPPADAPGGAGSDAGGEALNPGAGAGEGDAAGSGAGDSGDKTAD